MEGPPTICPRISSKSKIERERKTVSNQEKDHPVIAFPTPTIVGEVIPLFLDGKN